MWLGDKPNLNSLLCQKLREPSVGGLGGLGIRRGSCGQMRVLQFTPNHQTTKYREPGNAVIDPGTTTTTTTKPTKPTKREAESSRGEATGLGLRALVAPQRCSGALARAGGPCLVGEGKILGVDSPFFPRDPNLSRKPPETLGEMEGK